MCPIACSRMRFARERIECKLNVAAGSNEKGLTPIRRKSFCNKVPEEGLEPS